MSLCLILCLYLIQSYMISAEQRSLLGTQDVDRQLSEKVELQKRLQNDQIRLAQEKTSLDSLRARNRSTARTLARLSEIMNGQTWLSQLSLETTGDPREGASLVLSGFSTSNDYLGDFLNKLSAEPSFTDVTLRFSGESESGQPGQKNTKGRIRFQIGCRVNRG